MTFDKPVEVEQICQQFRQSDYPRGRDRALIDKLANGHPPYSQKEVDENNVFINVNDLSLTRLAHDSRAQFTQNFQKPGEYFSCKTDYGKAHQRAKWNAIRTKEQNKILKRSLEYYECFRSKFALDILHGIGPAAWENGTRWCPEPLAIADLLVPADTLLSFKNLPFFAIRRSYSARELIRLTRANERDPGWNMEMVNSCLKWIDESARKKLGSVNGDVWSPEKTEERLKSSGGLYAGDAVPTVDVFDFFYWSDEDKQEGWRRRIILDEWSSDGQARTGKVGKDQWLYNSGSRIYANRREEIFSCQFADLSAVAPFRYHSVRSLGFLLYAVCHIQNRLRCRFNESVFEALTMYFRVKSEEDVQRALKVNLVNRGFIDKALEFVPAQERFQVNAALVQTGLMMNQKLIDDDVSSYRMDPDMSGGGVEKTKFQVMAELNTQTQLVSAAVQQAYQYQQFEYDEIHRRFSNPNSTDPDVLEFRAACLKQGIPEKILDNAGAWDIEPERVMGGGNKAMELAIAQQLMQMRQAFDPDAQRQILHDVVLAFTDDAGRARTLVPDTPEISDSIHMGQLAFGALMTGAPVAVKSGINRDEYIQALLVSLATVIGRIEQTGGMATLPEVVGLSNVLAHLAENINLLGEDPEQKELVKQLGDQAGQLANLVKAYEQRLAEANEQDGGLDAKTQAEIAAKMALVEAKIAGQQQSHAQRTAQRQVQFELEQDRKDAELSRGLERREREAALEQRLKLMESRLKMLTEQRQPQQK